MVTAFPYYLSWKIEEGHLAWSYRREHIAAVAVGRCPLCIPSKPARTKRLLHLASFAAFSIPVMLRRSSWLKDVPKALIACVYRSNFTATACRRLAKVTDQNTFL
jgi:colanic acid biosynthesis glycosyl transferase WcaI